MAKNPELSSRIFFFRSWEIPVGSIAETARTCKGIAVRERLMDGYRVRCVASCFTSHHVASVKSLSIDFRFLSL